jgi:hypothetical protein
MAYSINDIRAGLKFGGARPTLFRVELTSPFDNNLNTIAAFMVQAAQLPGSTISPIEVPYFGRKMRIAGDRTFEPWTVTVMNDEDFKVRHAIETWHHRVNSLQGNLNTTGGSEPSRYKVQASVHQYSKAGGNPIRTYRFDGMFPTEISPIDVNWNDTDQIELFQVTFVYDYYEVVSPSNTGTLQG